MIRTREQHAQREATYSTIGCGAQQRWFERAGAQTGRERSRSAQDQAAATAPTHRSPLPLAVSTAETAIAAEATMRDLTITIAGTCANGNAATLGNRSITRLGNLY